MPPKIIHDGSFDIAIGRNRKETNWRNKEMQWSELVEKISTTHRTAETHAEYLTAKIIRQAEIKDIGGFVGGFLNSGRRKASNVLHRQLITLDLDYAKADVWEDFTLTYSNAAALYSTHKHGPDAPRLRLIIPLNRTVFVDEYQAIARKIAGIIGIELFDPTTFQPERLMYWPSTSKDGEYIFEYQDGPWLDADKILNSYTDWTDSSSWPVSSKVDKIVQRSITKQGDPLEKPGVIGAWCRTYGIAEVMELFLVDIYEACGIENRYTYKEGSTAAGLVVYDDKYVFSHHGTDPTSGKLCNAFDIVRLHKYGLRDEDVREDTPGNKLPSYLAMMEFASKDKKVRQQIGAEKLQEAQGEFAGIEEAEVIEEVNNDWLGDLEVDRKGNYYSTINNIVLVLENDPAFKKNIAYDDFEKRAIVRRNLPWRKVDHQTRYLTDRDDDNIEHYLESVYSIATTKLEKALSVIYERTKFHPVRDYLKSVEWDGEKRVDTLFIDYMGATDCEYTRAVTRKTLCAAVARVFVPGCKFDYMLTFVGKQGLGKSSLIGKLGGQWFSDSLTTVQGKEAYEQIQGVWLVEMAELAGLKNADVESIKHYIAKREDRYRVAYGKRTENFPRQCIFIGSTNKRDFLKDRSGNRRFWPLNTHEIEPTKNVFTDLTQDEIDQVWAEALYLYKKKEPLYLSDELEEVAKNIQEDHSETDERTGLVIKYLNTKLPEGWEKMDLYERRSYLQGDELQAEGVMLRDRVCAAEIWCEILGGLQKDMSAYNTRFIHEIMRSINGWEEYKTRTVFKGYGNQKGYFRATKNTTVNHKNTTVLKKQHTTVTTVKLQ